MALFDELISGISQMESELGNPTFIWAGNTYACTAGMSEGSKPKVETGGFSLYENLTLSVRQFDADGNNLFLNSGLPKPQQVITYQGLQYRIISIRMNTTGAYFRIMAEGIVRGA